MRDDSLPKQEAGTRREFLRSCVRYPVLAGMAVLGATLVLRSRKDCAEYPLCQGCKLLAKCEKPQAVNSRRNS